MKKINWILLLLFFAFELFSQSNYNLLKHITLTLPDTVYKNINQQQFTFQRIWELYEKEQLNIVEQKFSGKIMLGYNYDYTYKRGNEERYELYAIDTNNSLFKVWREDSQFQLKLFKFKDKIIIGISNNIETFVSQEQSLTLFYLYQKNEFRYLNDELFKTFNFSTDNYPERFIDTIEKYNRTEAEIHYGYQNLILTFTSSDTIIFLDDLYDFISKDEYLEILDTNYFPEDVFFWRYYKIDSSLTPIGKIQK